jgi:hypothetical protein
MRNTLKILVRKAQGKKPLGRPRRGKDNFKIDLVVREIECAGVNWIQATQGRVHWLADMGTAIRLQFA